MIPAARYWDLTEYLTLRDWCKLSHLIGTTSLPSKFYYSHFTEKKLREIMAIQVEVVVARSFWFEKWASLGMIKHLNYILRTLN
jgi:hypothetical protein